MANALKTQPLSQGAPISHPISQPFYTFTKRITEQVGLPVAVRRLHLLECAVLLLALLRMGSYAIQRYLGCVLPWDSFGQHIAGQPHLYDRYLLFCQYCLVIYALIINVKLFLGQKAESQLSWQSVAYDLTVRNADQARRCRRRRLTRRSTRDLNRANSKFTYLRLIYTQKMNNILQRQLDLGKLGQPRNQLSIFTYLSMTNRKKLLQFQFSANLIAFLFLFLLLFTFILGLTLFIIFGVLGTFKVWSIQAFLLLTIDLSFLWIIGPLFYRNLLLLIYLLTTLALSIIWHLQAAHSMLAHLMAKGRSSPLQGLNTWKRLLLRKFLHEHAQICALLDAFNGQFISLAVLFSFTLNAPTNIYLIYRLVYRPILVAEFTAILVFTFAQILCITCVVAPLAVVNSALYRTGKYLPGVQLALLRGEQCRPLKIKYEILQSTLTESRVKSGATIGPLCLITFESLYKVVSLYAAYMLVFFDLLPK